MIYPWFEFSDVFEGMPLEILDMEISVLPDDMYVFNGIERRGASGKTSWYIPLLHNEVQSCGCCENNVGLKILKYPVYSDIKDEYVRLVQEFSIQKILHSHGMAPDVFKLFLVKNSKANIVPWLRKTIEYPAGSIFFAILVRDLHDIVMQEEIKSNADGFLFGPEIDAFQRRCRQLRIEPYDLTRENVRRINGHLAVLDVHKWRRTYVMRHVSVPKYLQIELNNTCNARCNMCAIPSMSRSRGFMSDMLYDKILKEADMLGVEYITPFLHGEPFMRADFVDKLRRINEIAPKAKITIFTNASLLDEEKLNALSRIKNIEQIVFSFPGGDKESYESCTGLSFENSVKNIKRAFVFLAGRNLRVSMPKSKQNELSEAAFNALWKDYPHSVYDTYNYLGDVSSGLSAPCYDQCDRAFRSMTVLFDGRVCLCCMDVEGRFIMGDLSTESISDVWNGSRFVKLRMEHGNCRIACTPCNRCTLDLKTEEYNDAHSPSYM